MRDCRAPYCRCVSPCSVIEAAWHAWEEEEEARLRYESEDDEEPQDACDDDAEEAA